MYYAFLDGNEHFGVGKGGAMVHISEEVLEAIRQKANIVDYIGRYVCN